MTKPWVFETYRNGHFTGRITVESHACEGCALAAAARDSVDGELVLPLGGGDPARACTEAFLLVDGSVDEEMTYGFYID